MPTLGTLPSGVGEFALYDIGHRIHELDHHVAVQAVRLIFWTPVLPTGFMPGLHPRGEFLAIDPDMLLVVTGMGSSESQPAAQRTQGQI